MLCLIEKKTWKFSIIFGMDSARRKTVNFLLSIADKALPKIKIRNFHYDLRKDLICP
jgi:hypothetical protein